MGKRRYWYFFLGSIVAYVAIAFSTPPDPEVLERYDISAGAARLVNLTVIGPLVAIWFAAFYGFTKLKEYAYAVRNSKEGPSFNTLSNGLMISVLSFPLNSAISAALGYLAQRNPDLLPATTIIRNYLALAFSLAAFYLIGKGAVGLAKLVRKRSIAFNSDLWTLAYIVISCVFTWLIISHHTDGPNSTYFIPDWLTVLTIAIPYLYAWYCGSLATYCIYYYHKNVKGTLYKSALVYFSVGIGAVISTSVFIQVVIIFSERLNRLNLTPVLLILYFLVLLYAIGYGFIAQGAKRLKTLEEV